MRSSDSIVNRVHGPRIVPGTQHPSADALVPDAQRPQRLAAKIALRAVGGIAALLLAAQLIAQVPSGGSYSLPKQAIAGGGTRSSGGSYVLTDTAGQSAAGSSSAGNYTLQQGFHAATSSGPLPDPLFRNGFE